MVKRKLKKMDIDEGYAWVVLFFCSVIYFLIGGGLKSFGVLYTELLDYYGDGAGNTAWISSVCMFLQMGLGPLSNFLGEVYTYRRVMVIGCVVNLIGYTASAFVTRMEFLYLTYGVIAGIGYGLTFTPNTTIISFYFKKRRSFANGIVVSSSGIGVMCFPYLYRYLIDTYGLHSTFLIIGALYFHSCAACLFLRQPAQLVKTITTTEETILNPKKETLSKSSKAREIIGRIFKFDLFRNPKFTVYIIAMFLQVCNYASNLIVLPGQVRTLKLGNDKIALSISLTGASEIFCRAFLGWFADLNIVTRVHLFMMCSFVSGITPFFLPHLPYLQAILAYAVLVGAFSGSFWSLMGVLMIDCVGLKNYSPAFGLMALFCASSFCITQPIAGWLEDIAGSWDMSFRFTGCLGMLAFLLCLLEPLIERIWCIDFVRDSDDHSKDFEDNPLKYKCNENSDDNFNDDTPLQQVEIIV